LMVVLTLVLVLVLLFCCCRAWFAWSIIIIIACEISHETLLVGVQCP
jgi:hypothetical protein